MTTGENSATIQFTIKLKKTIFMKKVLLTRNYALGIVVRAESARKSVSLEALA